VNECSITELAAYDGAGESMKETAGLIWTVACDPTRVFNGTLRVIQRSGDPDDRMLYLLDVRVGVRGCLPAIL
jgi:hypothetical protein